jgi:hypothetical protein
MKKSILAILLLGLLLCAALYAGDGFHQKGQHLFSLGYGMSIKKVDGGTEYIGGPVFDRTWIEAYANGAPFGIYYSVNVKLNTNEKVTGGNWNTYDLRTNTQLSAFDMFGLGFLFQAGPFMEFTFGLGLAVRGTICINFTEHTFLKVFPYLDLLMGVGARADAIFNLSDNLFIDLSAAIDYQVIGVYIDGLEQKEGKYDGVLYPLAANATLGIRF